MDAPLELDRRDGIGIHQQRKFMELKNEYTLTDGSGETIGHATQERQGPFAMAARVLSDLDVALPVELDVTDASGAVVLVVAKPAFKWRCHVRVGETPVGSVTKKVRLGKAQFLLEDDARQPIGQARATSWRAHEFELVDPHEHPIAQVSKRWRGLVTEVFTEADSYAIEFAPEAGVAQRTLALASALAVDLVMKQKND